MPRSTTSTTTCSSSSSWLSEGAHPGRWWTVAGSTPFDLIVADLDYPLFVVSAAAGDDADACLVGFTSQCSIEPRRFAVFLSKKNHTYEVAGRASVLIVH